MLLTEGFNLFNKNLPSILWVFLNFQIFGGKCHSFLDIYLMYRYNMEVDEQIYIQ